MPLILGWYSLGFQQQLSRLLHLLGNYVLCLLPLFYLWCLRNQQYLRPDHYHFLYQSEKCFVYQIRKRKIAVSGMQITWTVYIIESDMLMITTSGLLTPTIWMTWLSHHDKIWLEGQVTPGENLAVGWVLRICCHERFGWKPEWQVHRPLGGWLESFGI